MYIYIYLYIYVIEGDSDIKKQWNLAVRDDVDKPGECYAEWNYSEKENATYFTYMWKMKTKPNKQKTEHRRSLIDTKQIGGCQRGERLGVGPHSGYKINQS